MDAGMIRRVKDIYDNNGNIMEYFRNMEKRDYNTTEDILISYDFQAGTYSEDYWNKKNYYEKTREELSQIINHYIQKLEFSSKQKKNDEPDTIHTGYKILEAGIGEGTTFGLIMKRLKLQPEYSYGFDISWSRIKECHRFLREIEEAEYKKCLFVGDMMSIPLKDCSIDIVYTAHALEPNSGRERELLKELYRVAGQYVILFEPSYELADAEQKKHMEHHGYIRGLLAEAESLGYQVVEHRILDFARHEINPSSVMVIYKGAETVRYDDVLCDPVSKGELVHGKSSYFSKDCLVAYPIIEDIPCLNITNAVLATKYLDHINNS